MGEKAIKDIFLSEAREILTNLESDLLLLEQGDETEVLHRIFRHAHTLKGSSAIAGLDDVSEFMHGLENVLDRLRSGNLKIDGRLTDLLLGSFDWVKLALFGGDDESGTASMKQDLIGRIKEYADHGPGLPAGKQDKGMPAAGFRYFRVVARFRDTIFESGIDPLSIMEDFVSLGQVIEIRVDDSRLPGFERLDPESCYLAWEITLKTDLAREKIDEVFLFVKDDNEIIVEDVSPLYYNQENDNEKYIEDKKIGEILVDKGVITCSELDDVLTMQDIKNRKIGDLVIEKGYATEKEITNALHEQERIRTKIETGTVRVDTKKLDGLLNLLGEIVIGQSAIGRIAEDMPEEQGLSLKNALYNLDRSTREFQEQIMSIRMIPIGPTFNQFRRFVRDAARELGKEIQFEVFGEETELDKTVIEKISDPLKHMIRNAIDHGIEDADERERKGKDRLARIRLNAYHQEGNVFIEVTDDGRGLEKKRVRDKAVSLGLLKPDEEISDDRLFSFIFLPGFSTLDQAGDLSGRGVGMDVVKTNIESLRGTVGIETLEDAGTTFRIKMPLTLAIIDGMLVRSGESVYIIPLLSIVECIQPKSEEVETVEGRGELIKARDRYIPLVRLYELFGIDAFCEKPCEALVVIVESGNEIAGIMVDELVGQQQIVIKNLSGHISDTRAVSGAAILGDGRVALILDIHGLVSEMAGRQQLLK